MVMTQNKGLGECVVTQNMETIGVMFGHSFIQIIHSSDKPSVLSQFPLFIQGFSKKGG
jgi:hypothetical protein